MNLSFLAQIESGELAQHSLVLQERTFWVSLATLICLGIYTYFTLGLWRAARKQLTELIYQRKRDVLPAFNVSSETRNGKDGLRLHNIGNGAALNVSIDNLHSKSNLGAGTIMESSQLSLVKSGESEFVTMTPHHDEQSTDQVHLIDIVKPLKWYFENGGTLAMRFQDIDGSSYVQNVVLQEHAGDVVTTKFERPMPDDSQRQQAMNWKRPVLISVVALALASTVWSIHHLRDARLWPFSTGTRDEAFLGTSFGMSPQQVRRSLGTHGAQLLSYQDYRRSEPSPSIEADDFMPLFSDDRKWDNSLYMSSIEMFDSKVEAEFSFTKERLTSFAVHFDPIAHSKAQSVVAILESKLRSAYQFSRREESQQVQGAYTLFFTSAALAPSLWVNLTELDHPLIILTVVRRSTQADRQRKIENRENTAFGASK